MWRPHPYKRPRPHFPARCCMCRYLLSLSPWKNFFRTPMTGPPFPPKGGLYRQIHLGNCVLFSSHPLGLLSFSITRDCQPPNSNPTPRVGNML
ncbi:hypothetical protein GDO86_019508 [Hymenochirus boettgeri]|uniref:Uncharacterized protein n=1 Tax=Hymenochirus boettgeri TaxID=247094 RepID=A0A8T2IDG6_9PIPI|nr:hypothetical protein GDO86_019508 [Hymenochirus boettgeri]